MEVPSSQTYDQFLSKERPYIETSKGGWVKDVSLGTLIQILCFENHTCLVEVRSQDVSGRIWILDGKIYSADVPGRVKGEDALYYLLSFERVDISFWEIDDKGLVERDIHATPTTIILEAARRKEKLEGSTRSKDEAVNGNSSQKKEQHNIKFLVEKVRTKLKNYNERAPRFKKIIDSMISDSQGNIIVGSNNSGGISVALKSIISVVLGMTHLSSKIYDIKNDDYICMLDSRVSMLISPIDRDQFLIIIFNN
jgi:hypothetical protein